MGGVRRTKSETKMRFRLLGEHAGNKRLKKITETGEGKKLSAISELAVIVRGHQTTSKK
jgi:hypothetical protein